MKKLGLNSAGRRQNQKGFTLIGIAVSLSVVALSLIGLFILAARGLRAAGVSQQRLIATMLAREGIELVRWIRDTNWVDGDDSTEWGTGICTFTDASGRAAQQYTNYLTIHVNSRALEDSGIVNAADQGDLMVDTTRLYLNNNVYTHEDTGTPTPYHRVIRIFADPEGVDIPNGNFPGDGALGTDSDNCGGGTADEPTPILVVSTVLWEERGRVHEVALSERLFNWFTP
jgi:type II secretory pathway pseudopilin PulG